MELKALRTAERLFFDNRKEKIYLKASDKLRFGRLPRFGSNYFTSLCEHAFGVVKKSHFSN